MPENTLDNLRHSTSHLLAAAVLEIYPDAKPTLGPPIADGFYYDFDFSQSSKQASSEDLPIIEKKMQEIVKNWDKFEGTEVDKNGAIEQYTNNEYKKELIEEFSRAGEKITLYKSGNFTDLCRGGHVKNPAKEIKYFKLLSVAGAYWRGSEKNKMLTRIYGTAFPSQKELDNYLKMQEEAKKRSHKKLGRQLELFIFDESAPGMAYWLPKGAILYNELVNFWRQEHQKFGYQEIMSPLINKKQLYEKSGHWEHYLENMFLSETEEGETYALKPMNCPNAMIVYGHKTRSYKDLPLRLGDTDTLHRYEKSGTLNGLLRIREFRQDDAHIFLSENQIKDEFKMLFEITEKFYSVFGLKYKFRLGTRPNKFMGNQKTWDKAERELKQILKSSKMEYNILEGDGAFYGPKIDILMKDALEREWQMGTLQLDFQIPRRFGLLYSAANGSQQTPVVIHRVVYGSLERFIGILIEHFAGNFPTWLTPVQVKVLPISARHVKYAQTIVDKLRVENIRVELDDRNATLPGKIRDAQMEKVSYMLVAGDKEEKAEGIRVRTRSGKDLGEQKIDKFIINIKKEIVEKTINRI